MTLRTECRERPAAQKNFKRTMDALFRVPEAGVTKKLKKKSKKGKD
jgi:hypothetical protein